MKFKYLILAFALTVSQFAKAEELQEVVCAGREVVMAVTLSCHPELVEGNSILNNHLLHHILL